MDHHSAAFGRFLARINYSITSTLRPIRTSRIDMESKAHLIKADIFFRSGKA
jgi:hypothetical protein